MGNHALFHKEIRDCLFNGRRRRRILAQPDDTFRETLPEGYTYKIQKLSGDEGKFKANFAADGFNRNNINQWVAYYEAINGVTVKIKARKKSSTEYALRHY